MMNIRARRADGPDIDDLIFGDAESRHSDR